MVKATGIVLLMIIVLGAVLAISTIEAIRPSLSAVADEGIVKKIDEINP